MDKVQGLEFLRAGQNLDGGWGYHAGDSSATEPTAAVILALGGEAALEAIQARGAAWLRGSQHPDGGWGVASNDPQSGWQTAWAVWALASLSPQSEAVLAGVRWLMQPQALTSTDQDMIQDVLVANGIDLTDQGWPWLPGELAWVEPTAQALLALRAASAAPGAAAWLKQGYAVLAARRIETGGWNVGIPQMLGAAMPPRTVPMALAVLALAGGAPGEVRLADLAALEAETLSDGGALALAWACLALKRMGAAAAETIHERLQQHQTPDGSWEGGHLATAVALLALAEKGRAA